MTDKGVEQEGYDSTVLHPTVMEALARVMGDVREVKKDKVNTQQHFSFRGIDSVVNAVGPALRKHGVIVLPRLESKEYLAFTSSKGTAMMCCRVTVTYVFVGPGGDKLESTVAGEAMDAGDKATAKAMSVAFRIALLQALALPTDDVDPDAQTYDLSASAGSTLSPASGGAGGGDPDSKPGATTPADSPAPMSRAAGVESDPEVTVALGEGASSADGSDSTTPATGTQWQRLVEDCKGDWVKAIKRVNHAAGQKWSKAQAQQLATKAQLTAAMLGEVA